MAHRGDPIEYREYLLALSSCDVRFEMMRFRQFFFLVRWTNYGWQQ